MQQINSIIAIEYWILYYTYFVKKDMMFHFVQKNINIIYIYIYINY